ncbi:MAG: hypothetical protein ABIJ97_12740, partial [Bacteroidota bacterium]
MKIIKRLLNNSLGGGKALLIASLFLCNNFIFAQPGQKYAEGGNNLSPTSRLGSNNFEDLNFYTNSQKWMVLTKEGNFNVFGGFTLTNFVGSLYGGIVGYKPDGRFF